MAPKYVPNSTQWPNDSQNICMCYGYDTHIVSNDVDNVLMQCLCYQIGSDYDSNGGNALVLRMLCKTKTL